MSLSNDEVMDQFCGVTGADQDRARSLLEACDWNLELAINMHVDTDDRPRNDASNLASTAGPSNSANDSVEVLETESGRYRRTTQARKSTSNPTHPQRGNRSGQRSSSERDWDEIRPPIPPVRQVLVQEPEFPELVNRPYVTRSSSRGVRQQDAFRDFQAEAQWQEMAEEGGEASTSDGVSSGGLTAIFRPPLDLMHRGTLSSAREAGTSQNKWLLVNIQDPEQFPCHELNRDVWRNQTVKDIIREHFIFWQNYKNSSEGKKYTQFYRADNMPHVSIIDPRTGEQVKTWPTSLDHNSFCDSVIEFLSENPNPEGDGDSSNMKKIRVKSEESEKILPMSDEHDDDEPKIVDSAPRTLYDQSEEDQLEAAIKASLSETAGENGNSLGHRDCSSKDPKPIHESAEAKPIKPDESEPVTTVQVRLVDNTRLVIKANLSSTVADLMSHIRFEKPQYFSIDFVLATTFPARELTNPLETITDAQLANASIVQKIQR